jgi:hypothetical protein
MKIYNYDKDFIFTIESEALLDPLETQLQQKDIFLIPAQATIIKPPIYNNEKEFIKFVNNTWQIIQKPDLTKKVYYNVDDVIFEFENITLVDQYILDNYQLATEQEITVYLFEKAKQSKFAEIKTKRNEILNKNIIFDGKEYKGTENARTLFCTRFNLSIFPIEWRLADDTTWIILNKEKSTGLANAFFNNSSSVYQKESAFLTTLKNAITIDDINNIIVNY